MGSAWGDLSMASVWEYERKGGLKPFRYSNRPKLSAARKGDSDLGPRRFRGAKTRSPDVPSVAGARAPARARGRYPPPVSIF